MAVSENFYEEYSQTGTPLEAIARELGFNSTDWSIVEILKAIAELKLRSDGFTVDELVQGLDLRKNPNASWDKMAVIAAIAAIKDEASSARHRVQWYQEWVREILKALDITTNLEIGSTGNQRAILRAIASLKLPAAANGATPDPENTVANQSRPEFTKFSQDITEAMCKVNQAASKAVQDLQSRGYGCSDESQEVEVVDGSQHLRNEVRRLNLFLSSANEMLIAISRQLGYDNYHPTQVIDEIKRLQTITNESQTSKEWLEVRVEIAKESEETISKVFGFERFDVANVVEKVGKFRKEIRQLNDRNSWQSGIIAKLCQAAGFDVHKNVATDFEAIISMLQKSSEDPDVPLKEFHYLVSTALEISTKEVLTQEAIDRINALKTTLSGESLQILFATESLETMMDQVAEILSINWNTVQNKDRDAIRHILESKNKAHIAVEFQARMLQEIAARLGLEEFSLAQVKARIADGLRATRIIRDIAKDLMTSEGDLVKTVQDLANKVEDNKILRESCEDLARRLRDAQHGEFGYKSLSNEVRQLTTSNNQLKDQLIAAQEKIIVCLDNLAWTAEHQSDR